MHFVGLVLAGAFALPPVDQLPTPQRLMYAAKPVYCANPRGRNVALTFDDGPSPYTLRLVRVLRREHARATFFVVGSRVGLWPNAVRAATRVGALGNHTWSHPHLGALSPGAVRAELERTQGIVGRTVGSVPRVFRPPYAEATAAHDRIARSLGLLDVRWSVDAEDSRLGARPKAIVRALRPSLKPGATSSWLGNRPPSGSFPPEAPPAAPGDEIRAGFCPRRGSALSRGRAPAVVDLLGSHSRAAAPPPSFQLGSRPGTLGDAFGGTTNTIQVPIGIAANICGIAANVLASNASTGTATCDALGNATASG